MLKFNVINSTENEIEVEGWQVYDSPDEVPTEHPMQRVESKNGLYWLAPKRVFVIPRSEEGFSRTFKTCCEGDRMSAEEILDSKTTVHVEKEVDVEHRVPVTETAIRETEIWDEEEGAYRIKKEEYERPVFAEYEVKDDEGNVVRTRKEVQTKTVTQKERQKVPVTMTVREAAEKLRKS